MTRLRRAEPWKPGITRRRCGKGWAYYDASGTRVTDNDTIARIRNLAIPPAWTDVWICPLRNGHIQAMGTDNKGRRQYRYHDQWRLRRDQEKFDEMLDFARALPALRSTAAEHLQLPEMSRERVLACVIRLLDLGFFRIGTEGYAEQNQTYGLATIRKEHVKLRKEGLRFEYDAKGSKERKWPLPDLDPRVFDTLRTLRTRSTGGPELFAWRTPERRWVDVRSADINAYVKEVTGGDFSAKDFRTWNATLLMASALAVRTLVRESQHARKRAIASAYKEVADYLGNTPAVCKASYVDPRVVDRYVAGQVVAVELLGREVPPGHLPTQGAFERAVLDLLTDAPEAQLERIA